MRRGTRIRAARLLLAYALALQALLGAWAGAATAGAASFDPSLTLCRTENPLSQSGDQAAPAHCVVMCLSGTCGGGDPPANVEAVAEYAPARLASFENPDFRTVFPPAAHGAGPRARGPPPIA